MTRALVERAQHGDREAYEELAQGVARRLFLVANRLVRDPDQAEDAAQQTLVVIWRDLPSLRDPDRFEAWAYRVLVRECSHQTRRERRAGVRLVELDDSQPAHGDALAGVVVRDQLERAFRALKADQRAVVVLHHYAGLPLDEIAEILGIPYGTVGSRLHYAMRAMRASIDADDRATVAGGQPA